MNPRPYLDSVIRTLQEGPLISIRFWRDGRIEFLDPAINAEYEYELAFAAMGGDKSGLPLIKIHTDWEGTPLWMLGSTIVGTKIAVRLAADYIQHVVHFYKDIYPRDGRPSAFLELLVSYSKSTFGSTEIKYDSRLRAAELDSSQMMHEIAHDLDGNYAASCVARAFHQAFLGTTIMGINFADVAESTVVVPIHASQLRIAQPKDRDAIKALMKEERLWQIRRFIDVVGAHAESKPIPEIEETV